MRSSLSVAHRNWCTQMLFTGKIYVTENRKMYTQNISPIFSGGGNKKDLSKTEKSFMVQGESKSLHSLTFASIQAIDDEINRWREILSIDYAMFLRGELLPTQIR